MLDRTTAQPWVASATETDNTRAIKANRLRMTFSFYLGDSSDSLAGCEVSPLMSFSRSAALGCLGAFGGGITTLGSSDDTRAMMSPRSSGLGSFQLASWLNRLSLFPLGAT